MRVETYLRDAPLIERARLAGVAEQIGFDGIAQDENRHDSFLPLAVMATTTHRMLRFAQLAPH